MPGCQRHMSNPADPNPGSGYVNPPPGRFYPIYTTGSTGSGCARQLGGPFLPGTTNTFGGSSTTEYGPILALFCPAPNGKPQVIYEGYHRTLDANPCPAGGGGD